MGRLMKCDATQRSSSAWPEIQAPPRSRAATWRWWPVVVFQTGEVVRSAQRPGLLPPGGEEGICRRGVGGWEVEERERGAVSLIFLERVHWCGPAQKSAHTTT